MPAYRSHLIALLCTSSLLMLAPATTHAQEPTAQSMALQNYEKAKQAYGAGDFAQAVELLQKAYAEDPDLIYQYNTIRALQAMGDYDEALKLIERFRGPMSRDKEQRFEDLEELETQIKSEKSEFDRTEQDKNAALIKTDPEPSTPIEPVVAPEPSGAGRTVGWILLGSGALAAAGTAPFWTGYLLKQDACFEADNRQPEDQNCFNAGAQDQFQNKVRTHRIIGGAGIGAGVVLGITGLVLLLKSGKADEEAEASNVTFSPLLSRDSKGASVSIRF